MGAGGRAIDDERLRLIFTCCHPALAMQTDPVRHDLTAEAIGLTRLTRALLPQDSEVAEGHRLVRERLAAAAAGVAPGRYQILAAINAVHTSARDIRDTDWSQVVALYDQLVRVDRSPIVALNRAIAVAEIDGPEVALATVDRLEDTLAGYHAYHATRADLLRRSQQARAAYDKAIELAGNTAETAYLTRHRDQVGRKSGQDQIAIIEHKFDNE